MKAIWQNEIIAESNDIVVVEDVHYFPLTSVHNLLLSPSDTHTTDPWKGEAVYYDVIVNGKVNHDAAWYYPDPTAAAADIKNRVAFWKGVQIVKD